MINLKRLLTIGVTLLVAVILGGATPPVDEEPSFPMSMLSAHAQEAYGGLTDGGQGLVNLAWTEIQANAPAQFQATELERFVNAVHEFEEDMPDDVLLDNRPRRARMVKSTSMSVGWTSAITGTYLTNEQLIVRVYVSGNRPYGGSSNVCEDCTLVYTGVSAPPNKPGHYSAVGNHEALDPRGYGNSYDELDIYPDEDDD